MLKLGNAELGSKLSADVPDATSRNCDECGGLHTVVRSWVKDVFTYGSEDDAVLLEACIPVWACNVCQESYTDFEAEEIRHEAVCIHLDRPSPRSLQSFRAKYELSQEDLARISRFGIASIKRWESGDQIPSGSAAQHLQLLMEPGAINKILMKDVARKTLRAPRFRTDISEKSRRDARVFELRPPLAQKVAA